MRLMPRLNNAAMNAIPVDTKATTLNTAKNPCRTGWKYAGPNHTAVAAAPEMPAISATTAALKPTNAARCRRSTERWSRVLTKPTTIGAAVITKSTSAIRRFPPFPKCVQRFEDSSLRTEVWNHRRRGLKPIQREHGHSFHSSQVEKKGSASQLCAFPAPLELTKRKHCCS